MASEAKEKEINLEQELYVHYHRENYLDYKNKYIDFQIDWNDIVKIYKEDAGTLRNRMGVLNNLSNKDGKTLANIIGSIQDLNGQTNMLNNIEKKMTEEITAIMRQGISRSISTGAQLVKTQDVQQKISLLDKYLAYMHQAISAFEQCNDDYMSYILSQYTEGSEAHNNLNSLFTMSGKLNLLSINKTAFTSFESLKERMQILENARNSLTGSEESLGKIRYKDKTLSYESFIYPIHFLFSNILGGIGEGVGAVYALKSINEFLKTLEDNQLEVKIEGTGTQTNESGTTNKADYTITINTDSGEVLLSFGISAKAQAINKGKKVTTTFETTKLKNLFEKYLGVTAQEKYIFFNNLYHGIDNVEMKFLRRKIAAISMLGAATGIKTNGGGENVLFLQYLDRLVRLDEFFESLATAAQAGSMSIPTLRTSGINSLKKNSDFVNRKGRKLDKLLQDEKYKDLTDTQKTIVAWVRSRQVVNKINELTTQIQFTHE